MTDTGWNPTAEEYHAATDYVSNSMLKVFADSPELYAALFVHKTAVQKPPSKEMRLGTLVHAMTLEPDAVDAQFVRAPECGRSGEGRAVWEAFESAAGDRHVYPADEWRKAVAMRNNILANPTAARLLKCAVEVERSVRWQCRATGVKRRCRFDGVSHSVLDIKTTRDPRRERFAKQAAELGYHRQAAFYADGFRELTGRNPEAHFVIAVRNAEPFDCVVYQFGPRSLDVGRRKIERDLTLLAVMHQSGLWLGDEARVNNGGNAEVLEVPVWEQ